MRRGARERPWRRPRERLGEELDEELGGEDELSSDLLAGWLHGTLTEAERARVEALPLERRELARTLHALCATSPSAARAPLARRTLRARGAALALASVAVLFAALVWEGSGERRALRALRAHDFARATELVFSAREAAWPVPTTRAGSPERDALHLLAPTPLCFEERPRFAWTAAGSSGPWRLRLVDERWRELAAWECDASASAWPAQLAPPAPGSTWLLEVRDLARPSRRAQQVFRVAEGERARELEQALAALEDDCDPALTRLRRAWCRARLHDLAGAADELARLVELLGEDAREPLLALLGDPPTAERVRRSCAQRPPLSAAPATGGRAAGPP